MALPAGSFTVPVILPDISAARMPLLKASSTPAVALTIRRNGAPLRLNTLHLPFYLLDPKGISGLANDYRPSLREVAC